MEINKRIFNNGIKEKVKAIIALNQSTEYLAICSDGEIFRLNTDSDTVILWGKIEIEKENLDFSQEVSLVISPNDCFLGIVNTYGKFGIVIDLTSHKVIFRLTRDDYHYTESKYPLAFFNHNDKNYMVHATEWNRLDITCIESKQLLTKRKTPEFNIIEANNYQIDEHYLDYFHGQVLVSPNQEYIVDNGWIWAPFGEIVSWNLKDWLLKNVWESEDGSSKMVLFSHTETWNEDMYWINDHILGLLGVIDPDLLDEPMEYGVWQFKVFDVRTGKEKSSISVTNGKFFVEEHLYLYSNENGLTIYDIQTGEVLFNDKTIIPYTYSRLKKEFISIIDGQIFIYN